MFGVSMHLHPLSKSFVFWSFRICNLQQAVVVIVTVMVVYCQKPICISDHLYLRNLQSERKIFKQSKNCEDVSDFDDLWTDWIAMARSDSGKVVKKFAAIVVVGRFRRDTNRMPSLSFEAFVDLHFEETRARWSIREPQSLPTSNEQSLILSGQSPVSNAQSTSLNKQVPAVTKLEQAVAKFEQAAPRTHAAPELASVWQQPCYWCFQAF